jgi:hypothetical protein
LVCTVDRRITSDRADSLSRNRLHRCEPTDAIGGVPEADKPAQSDYATENSGASRRPGNFYSGCEVEESVSRDHLLLALGYRYLVIGTWLLALGYWHLMLPLGEFLPRDPQWLNLRSRVESNDVSAP